MSKGFVGKKDKSMLKRNRANNNLDESLASVALRGNNIKYSRRNRIKKKRKIKKIKAKISIVQHEETESYYSSEQIIGMDERYQGIDVCGVFNLV
mmetsp:Transcript_11516/g.10191  ORF Transcript_11516/g.10191 Transcript_11516/m.10191 type:complete len:95 (-) Transcript_11516:888-1172(-)